MWVYRSIKSKVYVKLEERQHKNYNGLLLCFKSITIEDKKNTKEQKEYGLCDKAVSKGRVTEKARSEQRYRLAETVYIL